jgi:hypothetical protein
MTNINHFDSRGQPIVQGNVVVIDSIPDTLLRGLPRDDIEAIRACIGKKLPISSFNEVGDAELEFMDDLGDYHTIWLSGRHLSKAS